MSTTRRSPPYGALSPRGMTSAMLPSRCIRKRWIRCCCPPWRCISPPLRNDNGSDVEYSYEALKAYQMLYQPKLRRQIPAFWVMLNLQRNLPQNDAAAAAGWHLTQLLEPKFRLRRMPVTKRWWLARGRSSTSSRSPPACMGV